MRVTTKTCIVVTLGAAIKLKKHHAFKGKLSENIKQSRAGERLLTVPLIRFHQGTIDLQKTRTIAAGVKCNRKATVEDAMRVLVFLSIWGPYAAQHALISSVGS
ncbi:hypothetical protein Ancab_025310 [Ancistrocladus abbreviatus]